MTTIHKHFKHSVSVVYCQILIWHLNTSPCGQVIQRYICCSSYSTTVSIYFHVKQSKQQFSRFSYFSDCDFSNPFTQQCAPVTHCYNLWGSALSAMKLGGNKLEYSRRRISNIIGTSFLDWPIILLHANSTLFPAGVMESCAVHSCITCSNLQVLSDEQAI